ncbi:MAG: Nif3-like dinuclear metal center hexameric protein [Desulfobacteraceae bacterium 4572_35.2]|nr:MAG: Nif3-like dinuclear metal center hexameric protein [Desulfobacteraceae bacterium 4572_35.2]
MKKIPSIRLQDLIGLLNSHYPQNLAEDWDNVGLQVGDPKQQISKIMIALDPTPSTIQSAIAQQCQALITHHPLIFKPLKKISTDNETGQILFTAIRNNLAIISVHTNLDHAADGLNDWLANALQVEQTKPLLIAKPGDLVKLVVFVPPEAVEMLSLTLFNAGAGHIGKYDQCSFQQQGVGTFRAHKGCTPHIGTVGEQENTAEIRLETIVPRTLVNRVVTKMIKAHPYEEVAYDLISLDNQRCDIGLGRIGTIAKQKKLAEFAYDCKRQLGCNGIRLVGDSDASVRKVAVCGGSGAMLIREAARQGADVLVTGDIKYHEAQTAQSLGISLIDAGHFATEQLMAKVLAQKLEQHAQQRAWPVQYIVAPEEQDPFTFI